MPRYEDELRYQKNYARAGQTKTAKAEARGEISPKEAKRRKASYGRVLGDMDMKKQGEPGSMEGINALLDMFKAAGKIPGKVKKNLGDIRERTER